MNRADIVFVEQMCKATADGLIQAFAEAAAQQRAALEQVAAEAAAAGQRMAERLDAMVRQMGEDRTRADKLAEILDGAVDALAGVNLDTKALQPAVEQLTASLETLRELVHGTERNVQHNTEQLGALSRDHHGALEKTKETFREVRRELDGLPDAIRAVAAKTAGEVVAPLTKDIEAHGATLVRLTPEVSMLVDNGLKHAGLIEALGGDLQQLRELADIQRADLEALTSLSAEEIAGARKDLLGLGHETGRAHTRVTELEEKHSAALAALPGQLAALEDKHGETLQAVDERLAGLDVAGTVERTVAAAAEALAESVPEAVQAAVLPAVDAAVEAIVARETAEGGRMAPRHGEPGKDGPVGYLPEVRAWAPDTVFYARECVAHEGSLWQALKDAAGKPSPGDAWRLLAAAGIDGKDGAMWGVPETWEAGKSYPFYAWVFKDGTGWLCLKDGGTEAEPGTDPQSWRMVSRPGHRGKPGVQGRGIQAIHRDGYALVVRYTDGEQDIVDLPPPADIEVVL